MLVVLEDADAQRRVAKRKGVAPGQVYYPIFLPLADLLWACVPTMSQHELNHLILFLIAGIDFK